MSRVRPVQQVSIDSVAPATPQQMFAQMFSRRPYDQTATVHWSNPTPPMDTMHQPQLQLHHTFPRVSVEPPPSICAQYISPVQQYHDTATRLKYYNTLFRPITPGTYNLGHPSLISPIPIIRSTQHEAIPPSLPYYSCSSIQSIRYNLPRFMPKYPGYHPVQFPSPPFKKTHSKSNWSYRAFITDSLNCGDKDHPPITNVVTNTSETISNNPPIARGNVIQKNVNIFDYTKMSNSVSVFIQPESSPDCKPIDFQTVNDKPPYSISAMIGMAISASKNKQSTIRDIYNYISNVFPYYEPKKRGWKNSVRSCLKKLECFKQVATGGRVCWAINNNSKTNYMKGSFQKPKKVSEKHLSTSIRNIRKKNVAKGLTGDSLDSTWLLYAKDMNIKIIQNSTVEIHEVVPPDPPVKGTFEIVI